MRDVVVTCPKGFWEEWLTEGDDAGEPRTRTLYEFWVGGGRPDIEEGDRVYIVAHGRLRGYAPLVGLRVNPRRSVGFVRGGGAVAVTIPEPIPGFRGWRYRWWERDVEIPFPEWRKP